MPARAQRKKDATAANEKATPVARRPDAPAKPAARAKPAFPKRNQQPSVAEFPARLPLEQGKRFETLSARLDMIENDLSAAWTTALGGDYAGANAKLDKVETEIGWVESETRNLKAARPKPTWDDRYAAPDGGKLQLRPEFRGIVRETFYPSGYRTGKSATDKTPSFTVGGVKYWRFTSPNPSIQPKHPTDKTMWEYDDPRERPTAAQQEAAAAEAADLRRSQVRTVDRSERIRTYNFPENRIADHRTGYKAYNLDHVLDGDLDPVVRSAIVADEAARLAAAGDA